MILRFILSIAVVGTLGTLATNASASDDAHVRSYDVICVGRTVPGDPEPYTVCVPNPL